VELFVISGKSQELEESLKKAVEEIRSRVERRDRVRLATVKIRQDAAEQVVKMLDQPVERVPPHFRSLVTILKRYNIAAFPAVVIDGQKILEGTEDVSKALEAVYKKAGEEFGVQLGPQAPPAPQPPPAPSVPTQPVQPVPPPPPVQQPRPPAGAACPSAASRSLCPDSARAAGAAASARPAAASGGEAAGRGPPTGSATTPSTAASSAPSAAPRSLCPDSARTAGGAAAGAAASRSAGGSPARPAASPLAEARPAQGVRAHRAGPSGRLQGVRLLWGGHIPLLPLRRSCAQPREASMQECWRLSRSSAPISAELGRSF